ncbi:MAG: FecR family protein, partial [Opitutales bacterium]
ALALGAFLWLPDQLSPQGMDRQHYVASAYERHELSDGSVVEMNSGAAMVINFTPEERRVELVSSEALFNVAKDKNRPFIVTAKGIEVRAIGTAFNVRVSENEVEVLVTEGKVRLDANPIGLSSTIEASAVAPFASNLVAGQRSIILLESESADLVVEQADEEEILEELDWKYRLEFDSIQLAEAVEQINRRGAMELVIVDEELEELPIVATLRIDKMDYFADILELSFGIDTEMDSRGRMLLKKAGN